jgi:hypothetical protein
MAAAMERRAALRLGAAVAATALVDSSLWSRALAAPAVTGTGPYGPLLDADANDIMLPAGFTSRVIAHAQERVPGTSYVWPIFPDGGATFRTSGGWIYVANSEFVSPGGVSAVRFNQRGEIVDAYSICTNTFVNCAGGRTPWNTWLTCEEVAGGFVWECDPTGRRPQVKRPALGTFKHEAAAIDARRFVYLTEDEPDGRFYRFVPARRPSLDAGELQVAQLGEDGFVRWLTVPEPNPAIPGSGTPTRHQVPESTVFRGGEGIVYDRGRVWISTKGDGRVWEYETHTQRMTVAYDPAADPGKTLTGVDNLTRSRSGDLIVAEDGGNMELVMLTPDGVAAPILRVLGQEGSELAGPAFDPSGRRLYFSSQRADGVGITYEISGPFRRSALPARDLPRVPS